ncbi:UNVERIFIED_CONTAM: hypothetical protein Sradi_2180000 [Sesamum radiatum]|uniref:Uncharacterized protein n=1 Tax=Sesamum radiatum TaxID=300843 RepID=A0AAW2T1H4_SESRA
MENRDGSFFPDMGCINASILLIIGASTLIVIRIFYIIYRSSKPLYSTPPGPLSTLIVLGSDSVQWTWNLYTTLCNCVLFQAEEQISSGQLCRSSHVVTPFFALSVRVLQVANSQYWTFDGMQVTNQLAVYSLDETRRMTIWK